MMKYIFGPIITLVIVLSILGHHNINALSPSEKIQACIALEKKSNTHAYLKKIWEKQCPDDMSTNGLILAAFKEQKIPSHLVSEKDINFLLENNDTQASDVLNINK